MGKRSDMGFSSAFFVLAMALFATAACGVVPTPRASPSADDCDFVNSGYGPDGTVPVRAEVVASGLEVPWGIAFLPGGGMLVTERPGRIRYVGPDGKLRASPVAQIPIAGGGEGGLLGIALHPQFEDDRHFFVYATQEGQGGPVNRVLRYRLAEDLESATFDGVVLDGIDAARFHNGGRLRIGPDGMLWIGTGDARESGAAQDLGRKEGKLLRIAPDGTIPADNPFEGSPVYLWGIRNTQGFDWFPDGTVALTDHGPSIPNVLSGHDEVNVASRGDNLGWPIVYGCGFEEDMVSPKLTWDEAVPPGGAAFYRGTRIPEWKGALVIGTLASKHLQVVHFDGKDVTRHAVYFRGDIADGGLGRLREVRMGPDGELYVTTSNCDGRGACPPEKDKILRIVPADAGSEG